MIIQTLVAVLAAVCVVLFSQVRRRESELYALHVQAGGKLPAPLRKECMNVRTFSNALFWVHIVCLFGGIFLGMAGVGTPTSRNVCAITVILAHAAIRCFSEYYSDQDTEAELEAR